MQTIVQLPMSNRAIDIYYRPPVSTEAILQSPLTQDENVSLDIGKPRRAIILALNNYYYLTADQLTRLLFSPTSYTYLNKHLQYLGNPEIELVERILPAKQILYGRVPYVYRLSRKGRLLAKELGFPVSIRYRSLSESIYKPYTLAHILAVNEFLLKAHLLAKHNPDIVLRQTVHDKVFAAHPLQVAVPDNGQLKTRKLIPDSWVDMGQKSVRRRYCFCVEQNLTEITSPGKWRETVRKYLYCLPAYRERFGTDVITVLVSIQTGTDFPIKPLDRLTPEEWNARQQEERNRARRLKNMLQWTKDEAESQKRATDAGMFRFSAAPLDQISYTELFFAPHWNIPYQESPVSLLLPTGKEADGV